MLLIADTSPIISLLLIKQFDLLAQLFPNYLIPQAVWEELNSHHEILTYQEELSQLSTQVQSVVFHFPISGIERGETEAILLCQEVSADYLLIDDQKARQKAELFGIRCIGTLGLLYLAKQRGLVVALRPLFQTLLRYRRYYAKRTLNYFLEQAGENAL